MTYVKIRYVCGHEIDFDAGADGRSPSMLREQRLAQDREKCPACRHETVRVQLETANRVRRWR